MTQVYGNRPMSRDGAGVDAAAAPAVVGMKILRDFAAADEHDAAKAPTAWTGEIYNRENGKTYGCNMSVSTATNPAGDLVLHAYVGIPLFGKTQHWQRAPAAVAPQTPH